MKNIYDDSGNNNEPDYENNLAFPPQEIKSQDDVKHQDTRSSDVLIKAVEKCEKLEKQLKIAVEAINMICTHCETESNYCCLCGHISPCEDCNAHIEAKDALEQIKELDK